MIVIQIFVVSCCLHVYRMYQQCCFIFVASVLTLCSADVFRDVLEFEKPSGKVESKIFSILLNRWKHYPIYHSQGHRFHHGNFPFRNLKDFKYKDCGGKYATVTSLTLKPDSLRFPGQLTVSAKAVIHKDVDMPLSASVDILKKVDETWFKIPCINNVGSCEYKQICQQLQPITCPDVLTQHGIPCHCPFKANAYSFPETSFEVDGAFLPTGDYYVVGKVMHVNDLAACLNFNVTIV